MMLLVGAAAAFAPTYRTSTALQQRQAVRVCQPSSAVASPSELGDDECFLFDTDDGRKYVCTSNPEELAWHMGLDVKDLIQGIKPDDLDLIECSEEWSHNGTPQWVCKADS